MKIYRIRIFIISALLAVAFHVTAFGADVNDVYNLLNNTTNTYLNTIKNNTANSDSRLQSIYTDIHTYLPSLQQIENQSQLYLFNLANNSNTLVSDIHNSNGVINSSIRSIDSNSSSIKSGLEYYLPGMGSDISQLKEVLASDEDLAIRQSQAQRVDQINDDFLDSSGDASVSLGDLGATKDSVGQIKDALSGGASSSSLWDIFSPNSVGWGWFSQATMNDLDQTGSNRRSVPRYEYLDSYYSDVLSALGGEYYD